MGMSLALDMSLGSGGNFAPGLETADFLTATYVGSRPAVSRNSVSYAETVAGLLQSFPANTLRITDKGMLKPEPAATNLFLRSGDASNAAWARSAVSVTANAATGVMGTATATKIASSSAASIAHSHQQGQFTVANNGVVSQWRVLKKAELNWVYLALFNGGVYTGAYFDLDAGVVGTVESGVVATMHAMANGFYFCAITKQLSGANVYGSLLLTNADNSGATVTLSVGQGVYQDIGQLEVSLAPTSYIPTTTVSADRPAEAIFLRLPPGTGSLLFTMDDDSTSELSLLAGLSSYTLPTDMALGGRFYIKTLATQSTGATVGVPAGAVSHYDFDNTIFYWNGSVRALTDLTAVGSGVYDHINPPNFPTGEYTVSVDYTFNPDYVGHVPSGTIWSLTDGSGRVEQFVYNVASDRKLVRFVIPGPTFEEPRFQHPDDLGTVDGKGRRRVQMALKVGEACRSMVDNYIMSMDTGAVLTTLPVPNRMRFGGNARFLNDPLVNGTLHRVTIWPIARTEAQMDAHAVDGVAGAYHLLGDSFLNLQKVKEQLMLLHEADGYIGTSQDGIGGTSITQQSVRFLSQYAPKWRAIPTLVIMDGGFDGTAAEAITALDAIRAALGHSRWVFCESSPAVNLPGSALRIQYDADMATLAAYCGAHWLPTLAPVINTNAGAGPVYHDGSANDLADIGNLIWPRSLRADTIHPGPTPNSAGWSGDMALADIIHLGLVARGYLPA